MRCQHCVPTLQEASSPQLSEYHQIVERIWQAWLERPKCSLIEYQGSTALCIAKFRRSAEPRFSSEAIVKFIA